MPDWDEPPRIWALSGDLYRGMDLVAHIREALIVDEGDRAPVYSPMLGDFVSVTFRGYVALPESVISPGTLVAAPLLLQAWGAFLLIWGTDYNAHHALGRCLEFVSFASPMGRGFDAMRRITVIM